MKKLILCVATLVLTMVSSVSADDRERGRRDFRDHRSPQRRYYYYDDWRDDLRYGNVTYGAPNYSYRSALPGAYYYYSRPSFYFYFDTNRGPSFYYRF